MHRVMTMLVSSEASLAKIEVLASGAVEELLFSESYSRISR
jgi:hypothetical protein